MGTKQIRSSAPDLIIESSLCFKRCKNGFYKKVKKTFAKNIHTGKRTAQDVIESDEYYDLVTGDDYDYETTIQDIDGRDILLRFKLTEIE